MEPTNFDQVFIALDIYDVLAAAEADKTSSPLFQAYGMVVEFPLEGESKPTRHYVYPFVKEFLQLATATPGMHIAFFTSSEERLTIPFTRQLLKSSLGQEKYAEVADKIKVLARSSLRTRASYKDDFPDYKKYQMYSGENCGSPKQVVIFGL